MSQAPTTIEPIKGFNADITLDGGVAAETEILTLWSQATSQEAAAEANFALQAQKITSDLFTAQAAESNTILNEMNSPDVINQKTGTKAQELEARLQAYQSAVNAQSQIASSARDDATNKQQNLATNDLITTAIDPNNKVASLVTSLAAAIG